MTALDLPPNTTVVGEISVVKALNEDGDTGFEFGYEDLSQEEVIGALTAVLDRIREEARLAWNTCPGCGAPWSEHEDYEDDEH
jgi:hypothetical protein